MDKKLPLEKQVQQEFINKIKSLGWNFIEQSNLNSRRAGFNGKKVDFSDELILKDSFINSLRTRINKENPNCEIDEKNLLKIYDKFKSILIKYQDKKERIFKIWDYMTTPHSMRIVQKKISRKIKITLIDFKNVNNNDFEFTEEFIVRRNIPNHDRYSQKTKRPDLVLFVNGIPLVIIELKRENINISEAKNQHKQNWNNDRIPYLYALSQILIASNGVELQYGSTLQPLESFNTWRRDELSAKNPEDINLLKVSDQLERLVKQDKLLDIVKNFTIFDSNKHTKKLTRPHQYMATHKLLKYAEKEKSGFIYHTQGSGKSLTMLFAINHLIKKYPNSKIIVLTDRVQLDDQISQNLKDGGVERKRANSMKELKKLINSSVNVITVLMHKFREEHKFERVDNRVFIIADEAHRTQSGVFHKNLLKTFKNFQLYGFTGTPIIDVNSAKLTKEIFGERIHQYNIKQAIADKVVLPLLYTGKSSEYDIKDIEGLSEKTSKIGLKKNISKKITNPALRGTRRRMEAITEDIADLMLNKYKREGFTGIFATSSREAATKYYKLFKRNFKDLNVVLNISKNVSGYGADESASTEQKEIYEIKSHDIPRIMEEQLRELNFRDESQFGREVVKGINDGTFDLVIVVDKMLTGFDSPRTMVIFFDKQLRDHSILQAIARVNRTFNDPKAGKKDYGHVVSYQLLIENIRKSLKKYTQGTSEGQVEFEGMLLDFKQIKNELEIIKKLINNYFSEFLPLEDNNEWRAKICATLGFRVESSETEMTKLKKACSWILKQNLKIQQLKISMNDDSYKNSDEFKNLLFENISLIKLRNVINANYLSEKMSKYEINQLTSLFDEEVTASDILTINEKPYEITNFDLLDEDFKDESKQVGIQAKINTTRQYLDLVEPSDPAFFATQRELLRQIEEKFKLLLEAQNLELSQRESTLQQGMLSFVELETGINSLNKILVDNKNKETKLSDVEYSNEKFARNIHLILDGENLEINNKFLKNISNRLTIEAINFAGNTNTSLVEVQDDFKDDIRNIFVGEYFKEINTIYENITNDIDKINFEQNIDTLLENIFKIIIGNEEFFRGIASNTKRDK